MRARFSAAACWALGAGTIAIAAISELAMGRKIWGISGEPGVWSGDVNSSHNSQFLTDPYTFSHITHGMLFYGLFWIETDDLTNQVQVAVTTILTVIAFAFAISATMPRLPYLTYIDAFFLECYIYVFFAVVELMTVHVTHRSERRRDLGLRIRSYSKWVIPASFVVSNIAIAAHFLG